ncbi:MAG: CpaF family protein [Alphaproteobacteria bacterium]|nr:CpaF family protein [Alphaproteobacteria bacterium]
MSPPFGRRGSSDGGFNRVVNLPFRRPTKSNGGSAGGAADTDDAPPATSAQDDRPSTDSNRNPVYQKTAAMLRERIDAGARRNASRDQLAALVGQALDQNAAAEGVELNRLQRRDMISALLNDLLGIEQAATAPQATASRTPPQAPAETPGPAKKGRNTAAKADGTAGRAATSQASIMGAKERIQQVLMERIDMGAASELARDDLSQQITEVVQEILGEVKIQLNSAEQRDLVTMLLNDMLGLGPLEPLLADEAVTDIMVNGPKQVYVERGGKLELTDVEFKDNTQVMNIATRIVTRVGRRIDETTPLVDARLEDGSRVNIIAPPLAIDGASISIRKFSKQKLNLDDYERQNNMSTAMATVLRIASRARCNILVSGGTGSGKTTLLNALSQMIDTGERIVTIEDAAELQLQQPHVVRLETRPPNLEGLGAISIRDLVRNALRMRPDRIIVGEVRGDEALDMMQAMNTGHEGSMGTIHANSPREAMTRLENMIGMSGVNLSPKAVRTQISDALDVIVQVSRMRDGIRRIVSITEVIGMEGDIITTQELFAFKYQGEDADGRLQGHFEGSGLRPHFTPKAEYFGLHLALLEVI